MAEPVVQASFNSGEWSPSLYARVDIEKYHSGAALLRNFYVDYRGGASTRGGTKYIIRGYKDSTAIRLIPFQASFPIGYVLEFGDLYIRFHKNGAPVLESALNITGATNANPCVLTVANTYTTGDIDWVYVTGMNGMTELNGKYFIVHTCTAGTITIYDLFGNPVDSSAFGIWTSGGTVQRIYTIASPYAAADLALLKFVQNVNSLIICHPTYSARILTYASAASWTITAITFGTTVSAPSGVAATTTLAAGSVNYSYIVTAVDGTGQESLVSSRATLLSKTDLRTVAGSNTISWSPVAGAASYNVYKADVVYNAPVPTGVPYGFCGNVVGTSLVDSNIAGDFSQPPPTSANPFGVGSQVAATTITAAGSYTTAPTVTFSAAPAGGTTATGVPVLGAATISSIAAGGASYAINDTITLANGVILTVTNVAIGAVTAASITNVGSVTTIPANPNAQVSSSGAGTGATFNLTWSVTSITIVNKGLGYLVAPTVTFSAGAATATSTLGPSSGGFPTVPAFFQQRLALAASLNHPETIYFSEPGQYFNFNVSTPSQSDDAITAALVNGQLNNIKAMVPQPGGLIVLTDGASFLINGGSLGAGITPASITSNAQSFLGCNDMPPIVVNYDILYVQSKGSSVRDSSYNFYANVFTGTDISVISSHLFFGYQLLEWAWAEEPYKLVWAVRNDGVMLSLTFIKEQEFTAWAHHDTLGYFKSVATIVEPASVGYNNYVYTVVQRTINAQTVKYIEYFPERATTLLVKDYWTVDCGLQYNGSPATTFSGGEYLVGQTCTGLADGIIIPNFVMPATGVFTLTTPASKVTVGLAIPTPQLQTLPIDTGPPTIQSKTKKIPGIMLKIAATLGLKAGATATSTLVPIKDLVRGQVSGMLTGLGSDQRVTDLVNGNAYVLLDPTYNIPGQIYIEQPYPYPATILGVFPELSVGDTPK